MNICTYQTPIDLPGERAATLCTADGSQIAWTARPDDRRGASLVFDGLAATGVDWRVNPPLRVDIDKDSRHLVARLRVRGTHTVIITNAHYLVPPVRQIAIDLATNVGADLVFSYEDGHGTTLHGSGLLDDAERCGWPCHPETDPPFTAPGPTSESVTPPAERQDPFPAIVSTVGFGLFRAWNRQLLRPDEFAALDSLYRDTYQTTRGTDTDADTIMNLARQHLAQSTRSRAITALRAMQAALFRDGVVWRLPLSSVDAWLESTDSQTPTDRDYHRLTKLHDPQNAAIAVLAGLGYLPDAMQDLRLDDTDTHLIEPSGQLHPVPQPARMPLRVASELNNGPLITCDKRAITATIRELTQQFGFPLPQPRGRVASRRPLLDASDLSLTYYRRAIS